MLTTVAAFREPWEAQLFCGRLEAEGIPAFVAFDCHIGIAWHYSVALGGVRVQVPADHWEDARAIESLCRAGTFKALLAANPAPAPMAAPTPPAAAAPIPAPTAVVVPIAAACRPAGTVLPVRSMTSD